MSELEHKTAVTPLKKSPWWSWAKLILAAVAFQLLLLYIASEFLF